MDNDEFAFGYEFVKKAKLREINFGEADTFGEKLMVAGEDDVRKGFKICKFCGKCSTVETSGFHRTAGGTQAAEGRPSQCLSMVHNYVNIKRRGRFMILKHQCTNWISL